jgi:hypothetical protein
MHHLPRDADATPSRRRLLLHIGAATALPFMLTGCGRRQRSKHPVNLTPNPVGEAKSLLESYAGGQTLGSEREVFADLVARVTAADAEKGARLRSFFDEVTASGKVDAAKAKALAGEF